MNLETKEPYVGTTTRKEEEIALRKNFGWSYIKDKHVSRGGLHIVLQRDRDMKNYKEISYCEEKYDSLKSQKKTYFPITDSPEMFLLILVFIFPFVLYCVFKSNQKQRYKEINESLQRQMDECVAKAKALLNWIVNHQQDSPSGGSFVIECICMVWVILTAVVITFLVIAIIVGIVVSSKRGRGDYGDGGGTQVGGPERIPLFTPANDAKGIYGEKIVNYHLRPLLREDEYLLANLIIPLQNGRKTEIDCVLISRKGIFCIEVKNWVGHISGNDEDDYWYQEYDDPWMDDKKHRNPVKQNEGHCIALERKLHNNYSVDNAVIFAELDDGWGIDSEYSFTIRSFKDYYRELDDNELNPIQIKAIYQMLYPFVATEEEMAKYREEINNRYYN